MEILQEQSALMAMAVEAVEDDHCMLDTVLALAISFMSPAVLLLIIALPSS